VLYITETCKILTLATTVPGQAKCQEFSVIGLSEENETYALIIIIIIIIIIVIIISNNVVIKVTLTCV